MRPETLPTVPSEMSDQDYEQFVSQWIGIPYQLNGEDPTIGLDCRTLTIKFLRAQGINIKDTDGQPLPETIEALDVARYEKAIQEAGVAVDLRELRRNDIVYYFNKLGQLHVGVWLGANRILTTGQPYNSFIYRIKREQLRGAVRGTQGILLDDRATPAPPGHPPVVAALVAIGTAVTTVVAGGATAAGLSVFGAALIGAATLGAAAAVVSFGLGAVASGRKAFNFSGTSAAGLSASPRYAFDGARNIRSNQYPVPLVYSGLGIRLLNTFEIWNSGFGSSTQRRVVVLCEGEVDGITEVELNKTPIADFSGCSYTAHTGTAGQTVDSTLIAAGVFGMRNTAYLDITLQGSDKLSGDPVITCKLTGGRKVKIWNGSDWNTAAVAASGNPAACIRDYLTLSRERGGCGLPTSAIDDASFGAVYDYCEQTVTNLDGTTEPRARLDMEIDTFNPWLDNLQDMMATFGGFLTTDGRTLFLHVEKSESPVQAFTQNNIKDLEYQTFTKDLRPNRIVGTYIDPTSTGNDARTRTSIDDLVDQAKNPRGIVSQEVSLLGISRQTQCIREITKILNDARVNWYAVTFTADIDAIAIEAGDVFTVTHPVLGDGVTAYQFRAARITEAQDHSRKIIGKAYTTSVFNDKMEQQSVTPSYTPPLNPFTAISDVTGLTMVESTTVLGDGTVFITADASWTAPADSMFLKQYEVAVKKSTDSGYTVVGFTKQTAFTVVWDFLVGGSYTVRVRTVNVNDVYSAGATSAALTISGTPPAPATVANFAAAFTDQIDFSWDKNQEANLTGYEIRDENANFGVQSAHLIWRGLANKFTIISPGSRSPGTYYIRAYNTSGVFSASSASVTPTNAAPAVPSIALTVWFGFAKMEWTDVADADLVDYEVWKSPTNVWGGEEFLESKVPGTEAIVQGNDPVDATCSAVSSTTMTDAGIAGKGANYFVGDRIKQTSGTYAGQETTVTAYNTSTGQITVASWPSGTPTVGDQFVLKDRAYYKVRAVDTYGPGSFSSAQTVDFTPLAASEIGDQVISARKLITGELITLSAQIKDAIITDAKIISLSASKISVSQLSAFTADMGTITAGSITGATIQTASSGRRVVIDANGVIGYDASGNKRFAFLVQNVASFADAGDMVIGNLAGKYIQWDESAGTLTVRGTLNADDITAGTITATRINNGGIGFGGKQVFTSSGTFTGPTGVTKVWVRCWGGGGGGGGSNQGGGTSSTNAGGDGADTTFNSTTVVAKGGAHGGGSGNNNGAGGTGGTGDLTFQGNDGATAVTGKGGDGGNASNGGKGGRGSNGAGANGAQPGGGGAGGSDHNAAAAPGGGGGEYAEAIVSVTEGTNYTVTVGGGGSAGGAGSGGNAGGSGGNGLCIVCY